jgi:hypothetical protein
MSMTVSLARFALLACLALSSGMASATIIAQYDTAASTANATLAAANVAPEVTADLMSAGSGLTANTGLTWNWKNWDTASTNFSSAVAANDFWTWGFDVTSNVSVDLTTFDIRLDRSGTGPDDFEIQASVNGATGVSLLTYDFGGGTNGVNFLGIDLSILPTLNLGDSIVFTLAAFNSGGTAGTFDLETAGGSSDPRALRIEGTITSVPVPATLWLFGSSLVGASIARRRKKQA